MRSVVRPLCILALCVAIAGCGSESTGPGATTGSIQGRVVEAVTLASVPYALIATTPPTASLLADSIGQFSLNDVLPGAYQVFASRAGYGLGSSSVQVQAGKQTVATVLLSRTPTGLGAVAGVIRDQAGRPVDSVLIQTIPATTTTLTNADGVYLLTSISPGDYTVSARREQVGYAAASIRIAADSIATLDLVMADQDPLMGSIAGMVVDATTKATIAGAAVSLTGDGRTATSDLAGRFFFANVTPGVVAYSVRYGSYPEYVGNVAVEAGKTATVIAELGVDQPPVSRGLVLYFPLDGNGREVRGNTTANSTGMVQPIVDRKGRDGKAVRFLGTALSFISAMPTVNVQATPLTISFWMRRSVDPATNEWVVSQYLHPSGNGVGLFFEQGAWVALYTTGTFTQYSRIGVVQPTKDEWHHVCYTVSESIGTLYLDGEEIGSDTWNGAVVEASSQEPIRIGYTRSTGQGDPPSPYQGDLDDLMWFDRLLTIEEIQTLAGDR